MDEEVEEAIQVLERRLLHREDLGLDEIKRLAELSESIGYCIKESTGNLQVK